MTLTLTSSGDDDITFSGNSLTFSTTTCPTADLSDNTKCLSGEWNKPQTVTVSAAEDNDPDNGTKTITHTGESGDTNYDNNVALLTAVEADNDHDIIIRNVADDADITDIAVPESGSITYKVKLAVKPTANVTVTIAEETAGDEDITVSPKSLTFTSSNYSTARTVTLRAAQDDGSLEGQRKILHTASGGGYNITTPVELLATEVDNDKKIFIHDGNYNDVSAISVPEGGTARYVVQTGETIADNVTVTVKLTASGDQDITFDTDLDTPGDQDTITFTASNKRAIVELSAAPDIDKAAGRKTIHHTPSGSGFDSNDRVTITVTEIDQSPTLTAGTPTATTVPLTIANYPDDRAWWYQYTTPSGGTCASVAAGTETVTATGLNKATAYTFKAYSNSSCSTELATAAAVTTATPALAASGILKDAATLTLSGWAAGTDGDWYYKHTVPTGGTCSTDAVTGQTVNLTGLTVNTDYTYEAYSDSTCTTANLLATAAQSTTLLTASTTYTVGNTGQATTCATWALECDVFKIGAGSSWATGFTTGADGGFVLKSVTAKFPARQLNPANITAAIYSNAGSVAKRPDLRLVTLDGAAGPSHGDYTYTCFGPDCALSDGADYHLVFEAPTSPPGAYYRWRTTASDNQDSGASANWTIADTSSSKDFGSWRADQSARSGMFTVQATLLPLTVQNIGAAWATLKISHHTGAWWYQGSQANAACTEVAAGANTAFLTSLTAETTYSYRAYSATGCAAANGIDSVTFKTLAWRKPSEDFDTLKAATNESPTGLWSDGTTMWVADYSDNKLYAYKMSDRTSDSAKDITPSGGNGHTVDNIADIASNGTTMWLSQLVSSESKLWAYTKSGNSWSRDTANDISLYAANNKRRGIWTDGKTMWIMDRQNKGKLYAYDYSEPGQTPTWTRNTGKEFDLNTDNDFGRGIWSDGTTMWVANSTSDKVYAYTLATKTRDTSKEFDLPTDNDNPRSIWSDGSTMWIADSTDDKLFAYRWYPPTKRLTATGVTATGATLNIHWHTDAWWYQGDQSGATCTEVAAGTATATLSLSASTSYIYKAYSASGCAAANEIGSVTFTTPSS